jgi:hypothetical protein
MKASRSRFSVLGARFVFGFGFGFGRSMFGVRGSTFLVRTRQRANQEPNMNMNMNTNRAVRTEKRERHDH